MVDWSPIHLEQIYIDMTHQMWIPSIFWPWFQFELGPLKYLMAEPPRHLSSIIKVSSFGIPQPPPQVMTSLMYSPLAQPIPSLCHGD